MLTEDYIMRLINQALAVVMAALGLKKSGRYKEALQTFDQAVESLVGLNAHLANQLGDGAFLERLTFLGKLDLERVVVLADIFYEEAEVYNALGQAENCRITEQRSMRLYLEAVLADELYLNQELIQKIEKLRRTTVIDSLPIETHLALQDYLERMIALDDDLLAANHLSRDDLQAAFRRLDR